MDTERCTLMSALAHPLGGALGNKLQTGKIFVHQWVYC
jgi:hypothetical protein